MSESCSIIYRLSRLERDVAQKRNLLDDLRLKLRLANENARSEMQQLEEKSSEVDKMKATLDQNKKTVCGYIEKLTEKASSDAVDDSMYTLVLT